MKKSLVILLVATLGLAACSEKKGPGGILYKIHKSGDKPKIKVGDWVQVDFVQKNDKDSILSSTYDLNSAQTFPVGKKTYSGDMNDVLLFFGEGDSATFRINIDTMAKYTNQPRPEEYKKDKYLNFTVKIKKVFPKKANEADADFEKRANDYFQDDFKKTIDKRKNGEEAIIKKYIADNNLKVKTTASGLRYVITTPGNGVKPIMGDTAVVNYVGKFTFKKSDGNDNVFDTNIKSIYQKTMKPNPMITFEPRSIALSENTAKGFVEGLELIGKGGKITVIVPSKLGYGAQGGGPIGPYSPLVFDIELVDIKKSITPIVATPVTNTTAVPIKK